MSQMPESPATAPIPVQLSEPEFIAFIFPHLSMPRRGPKCKLGYHRVFNLILWVLYTGMQWKCLPVPEAGDGTAVIHYTTVYKVFAKWSDDGSLDQAFIASVRHLAEQNHLDLSVLHGDGSNTVAKKGGDGIGYSGHKHQKGEKVVVIVALDPFTVNLADREREHYLQIGLTYEVTGDDVAEEVKVQMPLIRSKIL